MTLTLDQLGSLAPPQAQPAAPQAGVLTLDQLGSLAPQRQPSMLDKVEGVAGPFLQGMGQQMQDIGNTGAQMLLKGADMGSFGLIPRAASVLGSAISPLTGNPQSPSELYAQGQREITKLDANHPYLSGTAGAVGMITGGAGLAKGLGAVAEAGVPYVSAGLKAMAPVAGSPVTNWTKAALGGATAGGVDAAVHNDRSVLDSALWGGALGPVLGKLAGSAVKGADALVSKFENAPTQWADILAKKLNVPPATLLKAADNVRAMGGGNQMLATLLDAHSAGALRELASMNPKVAEGLQGARAAYEAAQPARLQGAVAKAGGAVTPMTPAQVAAGPPDSLAHVPDPRSPMIQGYTALDAERRAIMDASIAPIRSQQVPLDTSHTDLINEIAQIAPPRRGTALAESFRKAQDEISKTGNSNALSVGDMDTLRQNIASKATGADAYALHALAADVGDTTASAFPAYKEFNDRYKGHSDYMRGYVYGKTEGNTLGNIGENANANDKGFIQRSIQSPLGLQGYASGVTTRLSEAVNASEAGARTTAAALAQEAAPIQAARQALGPGAADTIQQHADMSASGQRALDAVTPLRVSPAQQVDASGLATAAGHAALGWTHAAMNGAMRVVGRLIGNGQLPQQAQAKIVEYLTSTDPKLQAIGTALIQRAGATAQELHQMQQLYGALLGATTGRQILPDQQ